MQKHKRLFAVLLILITSFLLSSCMGENETYIQGTWQYDDAHLADIVAESHLTVIWIFDEGNFFYEACCFNVDERITGHYEVVADEENKLTIRVFDTEGVARRIDAELVIKIDREADTLNIQGGGPYVRNSPRPQESP